MDQLVLDKAVKIATRYAMDGHPVKRIIWLPPATAAADPNGSFVIEKCGPLSSTEKAPWD